jgi:hypothetical protein
MVASTLVATICCGGCDTAPETVTPVNRDAAVGVDVNLNDSSEEPRAGRRKPLLEAIDSVDVDVSDGRIDIDVE